MAILRFFKNLSAFQRVLTGLVLGILTGLFFGEITGSLSIFGNAYIRLLQMTVLPYVLVSIIGGLGRLDATTAQKIGIRGGLVILFLWLLTMLTLLLLPLAYPDWETAGFFSASLLAPKSEFNFLDLYIPANIFYSLANTIVPAVVLFCLLLGAALIQVKEKVVLLDLMANVSDALMKVASFVAKLAPFGIFAISASAAGTLDPDELGKLQVFLWVYLLAWLMLALIAMPLLVKWSTPFSYRELMRNAGEAMITALATGTVLVVLPMIAERCKEMIESKGLQNQETDSAVDVLVPTAYSFPSAGTLMGLGFILFSAWYVGSPLGLDQYASFVVMGALSAFGSMAVAIPFLLDYFGLPADQFQLYLLGSVVTARFATALAALHGFVVTLLVAAAVKKHLKWRNLFQAMGLHLGLTAALMIGAGIVMTKVIPYQYTGDKSFEAMRLSSSMVEVLDEPLQALSPEQQARPRLDVIRERGSLRVAYFADRLPFAFRNQLGEVVGFDMELMHQLAYDLDVKLVVQRLPGNFDKTAAMLADGTVDIIVGGNTITPLRATKVNYTDAYTYHSIGLIVEDYRRDKFKTRADIVDMEQLKIGLSKSRYFESPVHELFPNAELVHVKSPRAFFKGEFENVDAFVYSAEVAAAWTVLYPSFTVVIPEGITMKAPVVFGLPKGEIDWTLYMNTWLKLKRDMGEVAPVYNHWILGDDPQEDKRRWSIAEDVLGWGL
ncbi:cation:dicarboxylate symporter family transporter [Agaribacterium haliotis]|uniref:cation:dicarboxylate symporter family transporter n=1 Tax=Agaribacterium haliotis TaxID=2013869 RepID=UPI000BB540EA|nr:cation:dicarboxylase symporter family transporter [Agaribacterium haliotis]